jgi:hypothetical protein
MPHYPPADGLEEELGPLGIVDLVVDVGLFRLEHAGLAADLIRHPAGPHLLRRLHRRQEGLPSGLSERQVLEKGASVWDRKLEQPIQRELQREIPSVQRPTSAFVRAMPGQVHDTPPFPSDATNYHDGDSLARDSGRG